MNFINEIINAIPAVIFYIFALLISILIGWLVASSLFKKETQKSKLVKPIKFLVGVGICFATFGILLLTIHAIKDNVYSGNWETIEKNIDSNKTKVLEKQIKAENFNSETLKFNNDTITTTNLIFTIAGICLGTLGILWLAHLEGTRLDKDREHDQKVQTDRLLSLLYLGIDLFLYIDNDKKNGIDFTITDKELEIVEPNQEKKSAKWGNNTYYFPEKANGTKYKEHRISICKYLYNTKTSLQKSILSDIHLVIEQLEKIYYEEDIKLYEENDEDKRCKFIELLSRYNDYKNFLEGNTQESHFSDKEYIPNDKKISELIYNNNDSKVFYLYLEEKYNYFQNQEKSSNEIFLDYFISKISNEFVINYLIKDKHIYSAFKVNDINEIFSNINEANLKSDKFFNSYFKQEFINYLNSKKEYLSGIDLSGIDFTFQEYLQILEKSLLQIHSDINSVEKLYRLFKSFIELYNVLKKDGEK